MSDETLSDMRLEMTEFRSAILALREDFKTVVDEMREDREEAVRDREALRQEWREYREGWDADRAILRDILASSNERLARVEDRVAAIEE